MDMTCHLRRFLNDQVLREQFADVYEGRISDVVEEPVRNRFTATKSLEPIIHFEDGWLLIPNVTQRRALVQMFGPETDEWRGQRLIVYRHRVQRTDKNGVVRDVYQKSVRLPSAIVQPIRREA